MSTFKYELIDGKEYLQDADEWEVIEEEYRDSLRKKNESVKLVVFRKNGEIVYKIPYLYVNKVTEIG